MTKSLKRQPSLKALRANFSAFRAKCRPHARVPEHLRQAILDAIESGVEPALVKAEFGVTSGQVEIWRRSARRPAQDSPRVLEVIEPVLGASPTGLRVSFESGRLLLELSF